MSIVNKHTRWNDKCAVFGIWNDPEAVSMTYLGLYAQQHRGQEGAGIVSLHKGKHYIHRGSGLVGEVFSEKKLKKLKGLSAIGHNRYSTRGSFIKHNVQPLTATLSRGAFAVAHNGNIVNFTQLKKQLMSQGSIFYGTSDTECLIHLLAHQQKKDQGDILQALQKSLMQLEGAYNFVIFADNSLIVVRDPKGFRPLVLGKRKWKQEGKRGFSWVVASETCAFDLIGAELVREIQPGEIWCVNDKGVRSVIMPQEKGGFYRCVFELIYFARPDSHVFSRSVYDSRKDMGKVLAKEQPVEADLVIPVPDSGIASAMGYSLASGLPYEMGLVRNPYVGRTFIHPSQSIRDFRVKIKLSPQKHLLEGKKVVVVDDSLVRGTTARNIVSMLRGVGVKEIHFRVACPPIIGPCFYGVDTPDKEELIASHKSISGIKKYLKVDSLGFLSHKGLMSLCGPEKSLDTSHKKPPSETDKTGFCSACFTGKYPTAVEMES